MSERHRVYEKHIYRGSSLKRRDAVDINKSFKQIKILFKSTSALLGLSYQSNKSIMAGMK